MFGVLSLSCVSLFLMGFALLGGTRLPSTLLQRTALLVGAGILINYALLLTGARLTLVLVIGAFLASIGAVRLLVSIRGDLRRSTVNVPWLAILFLIFMLGMYYVDIFREPLRRWDARSIWFFHARLIWLNGAFSEGAGWAHPSLTFSHTDYPKIIPGMAAELGYLKGYWNEFLPKGGLLLALIPPAGWVLDFRAARPSFLLILLVLFFSLGGWFSNGYMDGYLAAYGAVSLLLLGRYLSNGTDADLCSAICALGICACLKNEGLLFVVCVALAMAPFGVTVARQRGLKRVFNHTRSHAALLWTLLVSIVPTLMWAILARTWGLRNDVASAPAQAIARAWTRMSDSATVGYVLTYLFFRATALWAVAAILAGLAVYYALRRFPIPRGAVVAATTSMLYAGGLSLVYFSTPMSLTFHLSTSATRTLTTANMALLIGIYFLLSPLEQRLGRRSEAVPAHI